MLYTLKLGEWGWIVVGEILGGSAKEMMGFKRSSCLDVGFRL